MTPQTDRRSQWLKGVLEPCVLGTLRDRAHYGYEIAQILTEAGLGTIKGGTLYPVLGRLEDAGLVRAEWRPGEAGPSRKYYVLTPAGSEMLAELSEGWCQFSEAVSRLTQEKSAR